MFQGETGRTVKDFLNGVWLGHPLHPVLTDVPIGAWTMAEVFDALDATGGRGRYEEAARVCINVGLVGAAGAAVTGLTDWTDTGQGDLRVGLIHAMLNITATSLFLTSTILRRRRRTPGATGISAAWYAFAMAGAYLGGALVRGQTAYRDRSRGPGDAPEGFVRTIRIDEIPDGDKRKVRIVTLTSSSSARVRASVRWQSAARILAVRSRRAKDGTARSSVRGTSRRTADERARGARAVDIRSALLCDAGERWFHRSEPGVNEARAGRSRRRTRPWLNSLHRRARASPPRACAGSRRRRRRSRPRCRR